MANHCSVLDYFIFGRQHEVFYERVIRVQSDSSIATITRDQFHSSQKHYSSMHFSSEDAAAETSPVSPFSLELTTCGALRCGGAAA